MRRGNPRRNLVVRVLRGSRAFDQIFDAVRSPKLEGDIHSLVDSVYRRIGGSIISNAFK
ncbi:hypothetical protein RvY_11159 [Ramazzottius varieornatus]|uniref:Uncharacterized protein n=1 Tax=Ramazzottius varieornatus TaxID=947166 RepID=A0A1D1VF72_RAMVA|nr:hypothetical protein RvY_11159 [Ramazzottius varieornatus]